MPHWAYQIPPLFLGLVMVVVIEIVSLAGLILVRKFLLPRLRFHDGVNDAISGTVQAIGVFYGITVGLIAVGVWQTHTDAADIVARESAAIAALYRDVSGYPEPLRTTLQSELREYTHAVIEKVWEEQRQGRMLDVGTRILTQFQEELFSFEPTTAGQTSLHNETLRAFNILITERRLRLNAVNEQLSEVMWAVIWIGAALSVGVAWLYKIEDLKIHALLVALLAGFLALVILMIVIHDRPFLGPYSIPSDSYKLVLEKLIEVQ